MSGTTIYIRYGYCLAVFVLSGLFSGAYAQSGTGMEQKGLTNYIKQDSIIISQIRKAHLYIESEPDTAFLLYQDALRSSRQNGFTYGIHLSLIGLGALYIDKGEYRKSKSFFNEVLVAPDYPKRRKLVPSLYIGLAKLAVIEGNLSAAYSLLDSALNYENIDTLSLTAAYNNAGNILGSIGEKEKSLEYLLRAVDLARASGDTSTLLSVYTNIINCYKNRSEFKKAMSYSDEAISLSRKIKYPKAEIYAFVARGSLHDAAQQYPQALRYYHMALEGMEQYNMSDLRMKAFLLLSLGRDYLREKDPGNARKYLLQGKELAFAQKDLVMQYKALMSLSDFHSFEGNYQAAYSVLSLAHELYDTILNKDKHRTITELETKYRTSEKDQELTQQALELSRKEQIIQRKNFMIYVMVIISVFVLLLTILIVRHKNKLRVIEESNQKKDREIGMFKAMLEGEEKERSRIARELHDGIISQLTAVRVRFSSFIQEGSMFDRSLFEEGYRYLDETMRDLRQTAHNLMPEAVAKGGLAGALNDFCSKMDNENATRIHFITSGYSALDKSLELSLYRIVQELVQNALKHSGANVLLVQVNFHDHVIEITVEDDGHGFDIKNSKGAGLNNIINRVEMMNGYVEFLSDEQQGTTVYIEIPLSQNLKEEYQYGNKSSHNR